MVKPRRRFQAQERAAGAPLLLDSHIAMESGLDADKASLVRRHVDEYFRLVPRDGLRLSGSLLSTEGLSGDSEAWRDELATRVREHVSASIRCEAGLFTWLVIVWRLYQIIKLVIEIYHADPGQLRAVLDVPTPATANRG